MKKITVLLADDHRVVREGLRVLVETEGDIEVVGEAKTKRNVEFSTDGVRVANTANTHSIPQKKASPRFPGRGG